MSAMNRRKLLTRLATAAGVALLGPWSKVWGHSKPRPQRNVACFARGQRIRVKYGTFVGREGEVKAILEAKQLIRVELTIYGRPVPVEFESWHVEPA
jgi:transcription antitermination factor NusG